MPIRPRWPTLDLQPADELIAMRREQHGGERGAPKKLPSGERVGAALNNSCILMLSALLQGYVEDVFMYASRRLFRTMNDEVSLKKYRESLRRAGNPSGEDISRLFVRLGILDVFDGLAWSKTNTSEIKSQLKTINELRNKIAHGERLSKAIPLTDVEKLRNFVEQFSTHFVQHVEKNYLR